MQSSGHEAQEVTVPHSYGSLSFDRRYYCPHYLKRRNSPESSGQPPHNISLHLPEQVFLCLNSILLLLAFDFDYSYDLRFTIVFPVIPINMKFFLVTLVAAALSTVDASANFKNTVNTVNSQMSSLTASLAQLKATADRLG